jgi:hypothetical protein
MMFDFRLTLRRGERETQDTSIDVAESSTQENWVMRDALLFKTLSWLPG